MWADYTRSFPDPSVPPDVDPEMTPDGNGVSHPAGRLARILKQASGEGVDADVVRAFVEALAVWHDAEAWGYTLDLAGRMVRDVSLPGSAAGVVPAAIAADLLPSHGGLVRLGAREREKLGFISRDDLLLLGVRPHTATPWMLAIAHPDWRDDDLLEEYGRRLSTALDDLAAVESSRVTWAMLLHLLPAAQSPAQAVERALRELTVVLRRPTSLAVQDGGGRLLMGLGDSAESLSIAASAAAPPRHLAAVALDPSLPFRAYLGVRGTPAHPLRARDLRVLTAAAAPLSAWLKEMVGRLTPSHERRRGPRSFEDIVAQQEAVASKLQHDVSMIVLALAENARSMNRTRTWVGHLRQQLRPSDLAGQLAGGDIGILLPYTSRDEARIVADRLRRLLNSDTALAPIAGAAIGVATSSAGMEVSQPLVDAAYPQVQVP
jgi:hypothetical protein